MGEITTNICAFASSFPVLILVTTKKEIMGVEQRVTCVAVDVGSVLPHYT